MKRIAHFITTHNDDSMGEITVSKHPLKRKFSVCLKLGHYILGITFVLIIKFKKILGICLTEIELPSKLNLN